MAESKAEMLDRVRMMANDDGETWDLSDNDHDALRHVLARLEAAGWDTARLDKLERFGREVVISKQIWSIVMERLGTRNVWRISCRGSGADMELGTLREAIDSIV